MQEAEEFLIHLVHSYSCSRSFRRGRHHFLTELMEILLFVFFQTVSFTVFKEFLFSLKA